MIVNEGTPQQYYLDNNIKANLDIAKKVIKKDWDMVFVFDGYEGTGKSFCCIQAAYYCDPTLNIDRIVFTPDEFKAAIRKATSYQAVIYDEAFTGLASRASMTYVNRSLVSMLAEIRQKNLFVFIVMPCFFDLDRYVALWRSRALIHVYSGDEFKRGYLAFYNVERKKHLYLQGKKFYSYAKPKPNFYGKFTNTIPINEEEYRKKKLKSLMNPEDKAPKEIEKADIQKELFKRLVGVGGIATNKLKAQILGVSEVYYYRMLKKHAESLGLVKGSGDKEPI